MVGWLHVVSELATTLDSLKSSCDFMSLDSKLASAFLRVCVKDQNLKQQLVRAQEVEERQGRLLKVTGTIYCRPLLSIS